MIVRALQPADTESRGKVIDLPGVGMCQMCDDAKLTSASQSIHRLSAARTAAAPATMLVLPRLAHIAQSPDNHVYLALDVNDNVAAQIIAS